MMGQVSLTATRRRSGTRNSVESAIDLSKRDKSLTWEEAAYSGQERWETSDESTLPFADDRIKKRKANPAQSEQGRSAKGN